MRVSRQELARLLTSVTKAVESRNTIPVLATVRLVADGGRLTATATNLDIEISGSIDADGEIAACVDAKLLAGIVAKLGGDVDIDHDGSSLVVKSGRSRFKLPVLPVGDFPSFGDDNFDANFDVDLSAIVKPVSFAMSTEMTRYYLCGVHLSPEAATATDGHRLATISASLPDFAPVILPAKLVALLPKGSVKFSVSGTKVRIETADGTITSKLVDGTYPDFERVIPRNNDKVVPVDPDAIRKALDRVSVVASERSRGAKFNIAPGSIGLTVSSPDNGTATEEVDTSYDGDPVEVGFNSKYVSDVLSLFPSGTPVDIALVDAGGPALLTSVSAPGVRAVVMPMRI